MTGLEVSPRKIEIEVTNSCPIGSTSEGRGCVHCSIFAGDSHTKHLALSTANQILKSWSDLGGSKVVFTGGEPLLWKGIDTAVEYAKNLGYYVAVYTSGFSFPEVESLEWARSRIDELFFTLYGSKSIHEKVTEVEGSYESTLNSIRKTMSLNIPVSAYFVPMKWNWHDLERVVTLCHEESVGKLKVLGLILQGRAYDNREGLKLTRAERKNFWESYNELRAISEERWQVSLTSGGMNFCFLLDGSNRRPSCSAWKTACAVTCSGDVIPCLGLRTDAGSRQPNPCFIAGNVNRSDLETIWMREDSVFGEFRYPERYDVAGSCSSCLHYGLCRGGCPARRYLNTGDILEGPDYDCIL